MSPTTNSRLTSNIFNTNHALIKNLPIEKIKKKSKLTKCSSLPIDEDSTPKVRDPIRPSRLLRRNGSSNSVGMNVHTLNVP